MDRTTTGSHPITKIRFAIDPVCLRSFMYYARVNFFFFNKLIDIISNGKAPGYNRYTKKVENLQLEGKYLPSYFS